MRTSLFLITAALSTTRAQAFSSNTTLIASSPEPPLSPTACPGNTYTPTNAFYLRNPERTEEGADKVPTGIMRRTIVAMEEWQSSTHDAIVPAHLEHAESSATAMTSFKDWFDSGTTIPHERLTKGFRDARFKKNLE